MTEIKDRKTEICYSPAFVKNAVDRENIKRHWLGRFEGGIELVDMAGGGLVVRAKGDLIVKEEYGTQYPHS